MSHKLKRLLILNWKLGNKKSKSNFTYVDFAEKPTLSGHDLITINCSSSCDKVLASFSPPCFFDVVIRMETVEGKKRCLKVTAQKLTNPRSVTLEAINSERSKS